MQWKRVTLIVLGSTVMTTAATSDRLDMFGDALRGLTPAQQSAFAAGLDDFTEAEEVGDGLGRCSMTARARRATARRPSAAAATGW